MNDGALALARRDRESNTVPAPISLIRLPYLRAWRLKKLRTQLDVAAKADVGISTIVRAEQSKPVNALTAEKLAQALGVTVEQLQGEKPQ